MNRIVIAIMIGIVSQASAKTPALALDANELWNLIQRQSIVSLQLPVEVVIESEVTSRVALSTIEDRLAAIGDAIDHPERRLLERLQRLAREPEVVRYVVSYDSGAMWHYRMARDDWLDFEAAGDDDVRWMRSDTGGRKQTTAVRAGVPHPAIYNVSRFLDRSRELLLHASGVPYFGGLGLRADSVVVLDDGAFELQLSDTGGFTATVRGRYERDAEPAARVESAIGGNAVAFDDWRFVDDVSRVMPRRVVVDQPGGVRTTYVVRSIQTLSIEELRDRVRLRDREVGETMRDFRKRGSPDLEFYGEGRMITWDRGAQRLDTYELPTGPEVIAERGRGGVRWVAIAVGVGVVLVGVGVVIWRRAAA